MKVSVRQMSIVRPAKYTPRHRLWLSNLDIVHPKTHLKTIYVYNETDNQHSAAFEYFNTEVMKDALSKALVPFYPMAGRLGRDSNGRLELDCNGEGVLFQEADVETTINELGELLHKAEDELAELVPSVDYSKGISSYPLFLLQVTRFKCGGVCLGIGMNHNVVDGTSALSFINIWAEMARGVSLVTTSIMDRTILKAQEPAREFHHTEHDPQPIIIANTNPIQPQSPPKPTTNHILKMTPDQLRTLKEKANPRSNQTEVRYSTYEILSAHIWRCVSEARGLADEQPTKLQIPVDARSRMNPPIAREYFGNVIVLTTAVAIKRDLANEPMLQTVRRIRKAISRMDDEYIRSSIYYMEDPSNPKGVIEVGPCQSPNLLLVSWMSLPFKAADFGWGNPTLTRKVDSIEGTGHLLPRNADGTVFLAICLEAEAMETFKRLFYETDP